MGAHTETELYCGLRHGEILGTGTSMASEMEPLVNWRRGLLKIQQTEAQLKPWKKLTTSKTRKGLPYRNERKPICHRWRKGGGQGGNKWSGCCILLNWEGEIDR